MTTDLHQQYTRVAPRVPLRSPLVKDMLALCLAEPQLYNGWERQFLNDIATLPVYASRSVKQFETLYRCLRKAVAAINA